MSEHQHNFLAAPPDIIDDGFFGPISRPRPGVFVCSVCGLEVSTAGALQQARDARDDSYRPDLPLRSNDASVEAWADKLHGDRP